MLEYHSAPIEVKNIDETKGTIEGYAATFGERDRLDDVIEAGAFDETLAEFKARGKTGFPILVEHNPNKVAGRWVDAMADTRGIYVKGVFSKTQFGQDTRTLAQEQTYDFLSIGYRTTERKFSGENMEVRHILKAELFEASLTFAPANAAARVIDIKSALGERLSMDDLVNLTDLELKSELEQRLTRNAGLSRSVARHLIDAGIPGLSTKRNAGDTSVKALTDAITAGVRALTAK